MKRLDYNRAAPGVYEAMDALEQYVAGCGLEPVLLHLVKLRASQINGCSYCVEMHWQDLKQAGEPDQRLYALTVWRDVPFYTERERAALAWTEAVTRVADGAITDALFAEVRAHFSPKEIADLTLAGVAINGWNRLMVAANIHAAPAPALQ